MEEVEGRFASLHRVYIIFFSVGVFFLVTQSALPSDFDRPFPPTSTEATPDSPVAHGNEGEIKTITPDPIQLEKLIPSDLYPDAHVPLFPWEIESAQHRRCNPPDGVPSRCCLGSSTNGKSVLFRPGKCKEVGMDAYNDTRDAALQFLDANPVAERHCDVCQIVDHLLAANRTLTFQGDSMTRQSFAGLECELLRRGYDVEVVGGYNQDYSGRSEERWEYGLTHTSVLKVRQSVNATSFALLQYFAIYRPIEDMKEVEMVFNQSDIVVFDHGLHYLAHDKVETEVFLNCTVEILRVAHTQWKGDPSKLLVWRETPAQHFRNATGGHFESSLKDHSCGPIANSDPNERIRFQLVEQAAAAEGYQIVNASQLSPQRNQQQQLVVIPFRQFTEPLHNMHPMPTADCSHYCWTPYVWLPVWRNLRIAMDLSFTASPA